MDLLRAACRTVVSRAETAEQAVAGVPGAVWADVTLEGKQVRLLRFEQSLLKLGGTNHTACDQHRTGPPDCRNKWQVRPTFTLFPEPNQTITLGQLSDALGRPKLFKNAGPSPREYVLPIESGAKETCFAWIHVVPAEAGEAAAIVRIVEVKTAVAHLGETDLPDPVARLDPGWSSSRCVLAASRRAPAAATCGSITDARAKKRIEALCERIEQPRPGGDGLDEDIQLSDPLLGQAWVQALGVAFPAVLFPESAEDRRLAQLPRRGKSNSALFTSDAGHPAFAGDVLAQLGPACSSDPDAKAAGPLLTAERKLHYFVRPTSTGVSCTLIFSVAPPTGDLRRVALRDATLVVGVMLPNPPCLAATVIPSR